MRSINWIIKQLRQDYPQFTFESADKFWWSADKTTIYFNHNAQDSQVYCLHELSHALLGHRGYEYDIDLIKLERDAWNYACVKLAPRYNVVIDAQTIQDNLDTYRDWLHARSACPDCAATGLQSKQHYRCLACGHTWRVNDARICALRRYSLQTK